MKKHGLIKLLAGFTLVLSGGFALATNSAIKAKENEPVEIMAETPSDYPYIYRFVVPGNFGSDVGNKIWIKGTGSSGYDFQGWGEITQYSYDENSNRIYIFPTEHYYGQFQIARYGDNPTYCMSTQFSTSGPYGSAKCWYWDGNNGTSPTVIQNTTKTFYLYDYKNMFGGNAKCYAWQSCGGFNNGSYPGQTMNKVTWGSGQLYTIALDQIFDQCIFGIGDSANTGDQWINQHPGECFCWWDVGDSNWNADMDWIKAHDWIYQTMHIRDIATSDKSDTGACRGDNGYYKKAKTAYQNFTTAVKTKISQDECFDLACARFHDWSLANGEDATISGTTLTVSARNNILFDNSGANESSLIIILTVSILSISTLGVLIVLKRKKSSINSK